MQLYSTTYQNLYRSVSGTITINNDDSMLYCNTSSGAVVINLIDIPTDRWSTQYKLYVIDNSNNAATNNITINAPTGFTINGSSSFVMSTNGESCIVKISSNTNFIAESSISGGGGVVIAFEGTNWSFVYGNGTHTANATQLQNAYNSAKTKTPNGLPLSATNRFTVIVGAGYYEFASTFTLDTDFIDIVSLTGKTDVILSGAGTISVATDNVKINGISVLTKAFQISTSSTDIICENCIGGNNSFGSGATIISGTFTNCVGGNNSFGSNGTASGTFTNCTGGQFAFGGNSSGTASGTFTNCTGGNNSFGGLGGTTAGGVFIGCVGGSGSFGGQGGTASGTFTDCTGGQYSFGNSGTASGIFTNCTGAQYSFGTSGTASGTFKYCKGVNDSFGGGSGGTASGTFISCVGGNGSFGENTSSGAYMSDCIGGDNSFAGGDNGGNTAAGIFINCIGGHNSFGGGDNNGGVASGNFFNCKGGSGSFGGGEISGVASGEFFNCQAGSESFGNFICSGELNNCQAGSNSFGGAIGGTLTGKLYFCRLTTSGGTFRTVSGGGRTIYCIDGNNNINNQ
jgi:hypothetical protein